MGEAQVVEVVARCGFIHIVVPRTALATSDAAKRQPPMATERSHSLRGGLLWACARDSWDESSSL